MPWVNRARNVAPESHPGRGDSRPGPGFRRHPEGEIRAEPNLLFFKGRASTRLLARICVQCGYTELFAEHPEVLDEAYRDVLEQEDNE